MSGSDERAHSQAAESADAGESLDGGVTDADVSSEPTAPDGDPTPGSPGDAGDWDAAAAALADDPATAASIPGEAQAGDLSVEALVASLEQVTAERDALAEARMRMQADFENTRKQMAKRQADQAERANEVLVGQLLEVLDAMDAAVAHGSDVVGPLQTKLLEVLGKAGLEVLASGGEPFDPTLHEAVMHEPAADDEDGQTIVSEVLRTGYAWKGRTLRPAMVKVRG